MKFGALVGVVVAAGCGSVSSEKMDAPAQSDAHVDSATDTPSGPCNLNGPFIGATEVTGATNVSSATISYDEKVIYYTSGTNYDIFRATRASATGAFGVGALAPGTSNMVLAPAQNEPETALYTHSGQGAILVSTRASTTASFSSFASTNISGADAFISRRALYYRTMGDIYAAPLNAGVLGTPARVDSLATSASESAPVVSGDELEAAFNRSANELYVASRSSLTSDFGTATVVTIGVGTSVTAAGFSDDRCRLYVTVGIGNNAPLYVLHRE